MRNYRRIGILGGMGPEATAELYMRIVRIFQTRYGAVYDSDFPEIFIVSLPIPDVVGNVQESDKINRMLVGAAKKLESSGSDFIVVPCNTVSSYLADIRKSVSVPILSIIEEVAGFVSGKGAKTFGLLATEATIRSNMYNTAMKDVRIVTLQKAEQEETTRIIFDILAGRKAENDRLKLLSLVGKLRKLGAEKVIVGCTDLSLVLSQDDVLIDTLDVLAESAVRMAIS